MLQYLYHGRYDVLNIAEGLTRILGQASSTTTFNHSVLAQDYDIEIHAAMYAVADRFEVPILKAVSLASFVSELRSNTFSIADLVAAIEVVYITTPENDIRLRKWVVYRAQQFSHELIRHAGFQAAFETHPDFAWDFATKYAKANYLWCTQCNDTIDLTECRCGFSAMRGDPLCNAGVMSVLPCMHCNNLDTLQREVPRLEGNVALGALGRTDCPNGPVRRSQKKSRLG
jgi:hypothetical protein